VNAKMEKKNNIEVTVIKWAVPLSIGLHLLRTCSHGGLNMHQLSCSNTTD
jgi:hypothetical protein